MKTLKMYCVDGINLADKNVFAYYSYSDVDVSDYLVSHFEIDNDVFAKILDVLFSSTDLDKHFVCVVDTFDGELVVLNISICSCEVCDE